MTSQIGAEVISATGIFLDGPGPPQEGLSALDEIVRQPAAIRIPTVWAALSDATGE